VIIGLTGGIGSGKSLVAEYLAGLLDFAVLNADLLCRNQLQPQMPGWQAIKDQWGSRFIDLTGNIDRPVLRKALFTDARVRHSVEQILHPLVRQEISKKRSAAADVIVEVPLLFEVGWQEDFDWIVVVYAANECCLQRIVNRDRISMEEARLAVSVQMSLADKALWADSVIENSGSLAQTILQIYHLAHVLKRLS